jgi:four helix bundle protein
LRQTNLWGPKDFLLHVKTSRKEAKESRYWLRLLDLEAKPALEAERDALVQEARELVLIFSAIIRKRS